MSRLGELYRNLRNMANFKVPREQMDKTYTCAICIKPHMPFVLYERGFELDPDLRVVRQGAEDLERVLLGRGRLG